LFLCIQEEHFEGKGVKVVKKMQTFKDQHGLMRVKTTLLLSDEEKGFKCPVLLPDDNPICSPNGLLETLSNATFGFEDVDNQISGSLLDCWHQEISQKHRKTMYNLPEIPGQGS
jgi:hypothetical protein